MDLRSRGYGTRVRISFRFAVESVFAPLVWPHSGRSTVPLDGFTVAFVVLAAARLSVGTVRKVSSWERIPLFARHLRVPDFRFWAFVPRKLVIRALGTP